MERKPLGNTSVALPEIGLGTWKYRGGPEALRLDALFDMIRHVHGARPRGALHLPVAPFRMMLSFAEPFLLPVLPFTAGQLSIFENDTCAEGGPASAGTVAPTIGVREMLLRRSVEQ